MRPRDSRIRRRPDRFSVQTHRRRAEGQLRRFRQGTILAVAITTLLLLLAGPDATVGQDEQAASEEAPVEVNDDGADDPAPVEADPQAALEEAAGTVRDLMVGFYALWPKVVVALLLLLLAWGLASLFRWAIRRVGQRWERVEAYTALARVVLMLLAVGAGLSVIAGDARALIGSVGLAGLALSWALQTPIESFTGWVLNAFRGYYQPGDRIEVGEVFGDVYRIDILTTTVWEAGGEGKSVAGAQPTGSLITFPNWEILRSNIINYTRDFPFCWDEVTLGVANESDLSYTVEVLRNTADSILGKQMYQPAEHYRKLLERERLAFDVEPEPQIYLSLTDAWTNCTIRYLVPVRERRRWSSKLILALSEELAKPEHQGRIIGAYPRTQVELRQADGTN